MSAASIQAGAGRIGAAAQSPSPFVRLRALLAEIGSLWAEVQAMRREAHRRYPHLDT
jgi:hypothetical protein